MGVQCEKCGRSLTDPVSIARGVGPVCAGGEHRTNRYKKPEKRAAYERALELAGQLSDDAIWKRGAYWNIANQLDSNLSREDRRQIAAKAIRVTRGIRRKETE